MTYPGSAGPAQALCCQWALFLVTEWNEFRNPDYGRLAQVMRGRALFDGRNVWDPQKARAAGFQYYGVGRYCMSIAHVSQS